jgi:hypothetical protein
MTHPRVTAPSALAFALALVSSCAIEGPAGPSASTQEELEEYAGQESLPSLFLSGTVSDLSPLSSLRFLSFLVVADTTQLHTLRGLENLRDPEKPESPPVLWIQLYRNAVLEDVSALSMPRLRSFYLQDGNTSLANLVLGPVEEVDAVYLTNAVDVVRFAAPSLRAIHDVLDISGTPLCEVDLPALRELGTLNYLVDPPCWPQEEQDALLAQTQPAE